MGFHNSNLPLSVSLSFLSLPALLHQAFVGGRKRGKRDIRDRPWNKTSLQGREKKLFPCCENRNTKKRGGKWATVETVLILVGRRKMPHQDCRCCSFLVIWAPNLPPPPCSSVVVGWLCRMQKIMFPHLATGLQAFLSVEVRVTGGWVGGGGNGPLVVFYGRPSCHLAP